MENKYEDLTGRQFGYLKVLGPAEANENRRSWKVECVCGKRFVLGNTLLLGSKTRNANKSCGCKHNAQKGYSSKSPRLFSIWHTMKIRCYTKKSEIYQKYGKKGIKICDEWLKEFEPFYNWAMGNGYKDDLSIDRIDTTKGYYPENCRWATAFEQAQNKLPSKKSKTGYLGVFEYKYGYRASIMRNSIRYYLGSSHSLKEAILLREKAEEEYKQTGEVKTYISKEIM